MTFHLIVMLCIELPYAFKCNYDVFLWFPLIPCSFNVVKYMIVSFFQFFHSLGKIIVGQIGYTKRE
jgi:hypothetical protein